MVISSFKVCDFTLLSKLGRETKDILRISKSLSGWIVKRKSDPLLYKALKILYGVKNLMNQKARIIAIRRFGAEEAGRKIIKQINKVAFNQLS